MEQDFSKKMVIVMRRDLEQWKILNAVAHIAAKLGRNIKQFDTGAAFISADAVSMPRNSQYPIVVLEIRSSDELRALLRDVRAAQLPYLAFIREMIDHNDDVELQGALNEKPESDIEYLGVGMFGENDTLRTLSKRFALWKG